MSNIGTKYLGPEKSFFLLFICEIDLKVNVYKTRMHSSRMRPAHSLLHGGSLSRGVSPGHRPPWTQTPQDRETHPGQRSLPWTEMPQTETSLDKDPSGQRPPPLWTEIPQDRDPLDRDPLMEKTPLDRDFPPPWTETPLDRDLLGQRSPGQRPPPRQRLPGQRPPLVM